MNRIKSRFSFFVLLLIILWLIIVPTRKAGENTLSWDVFGYYLYTPATMIWQDVELKDFSKPEAINNKYQNTGTFYQGNRTEQGSWMIKYTMGLAVLELPFFIIAHKLAPILDYPPDGFSPPYQVAMLYAHFFYLIIGFIFLRKVLLHFFSDKISALLMILLVLGTNFLVMAMLTNGMSPIHTIEFSLISVFLYYTIQWHQYPTIQNAGILAFLLGLITLVRPSDILVVFIPLLWNIKNYNDLKTKLTEIFKNKKVQIMFMALIFFIVLFPQLYYWKTVSGNWFLYSYNNNPGEGFEFGTSYLMKVLFSFRKGWLLYTPLMAIAILGFYYLYKKNKNIFLPLIVFFVVNLYVISSWSCWWYAGSFSQRPLVDSYAIMLLPLGYFIESVRVHKRIIRNAVIALFSVIMILNLFQCWQYSQKIIDGSRMTKAYYFSSFGKTSITEADKKLLLIPRSSGEEEILENENEYSKQILFEENFNDPSAENRRHYNDSIPYEKPFCLQMDSAFIFTPKHEYDYSSLTQKDHAWIRATFWYYPITETDKSNLSLVICFNHKEGLYKYSAFVVGKRKQDKPIIGQWNKYVVDYITPEVRSVNDKLNMYFWLQGKSPILVDDLKVEVFEKK